MLESVAFQAAESVEQACALLADQPDARPVCGGTALTILLRQGLIRPKLLVGIGRIPRLRELQAEETLRLGAAVPLRVAERYGPLVERWSVLAETIRKVATPRIRNMATIGGGLAHADPAQDPPVTFVALGASIQVASTSGERSIPASEFFMDYYETVLKEGELVTGIEVPPLEPGSGAAFLKFLPRSVDDYATVAATAVVRLDETGACQAARVALGAVGPTPILVDLTDALAGQPIDAAGARQAAEGVRDLVDPTEDIRGTAEYKRDMAVVFARRALLAAAERAGGTPTASNGRGRPL
jgi:carbon-monoxide dehydrogenase medium subunit